MRDLVVFASVSFDLIVHPVSNVFIPDVRPVWREAYRVLRPGGSLLAGFMNPFNYLWDTAAADRGELVLRHRLPYSDLTSLTEEELRAQIARGDALEWSHMLEDQLGGQMEAGFVLTGLYEDYHGQHPIARYAPSYLATRALKLEAGALPTGHEGTQAA